VTGVLPSVRLERKPRMADFARILAAVDIVLGTDGLNRFLAKQGAAAVDTLSADPFITAMATTFVDDRIFIGTAAELLNQVEPPADMRSPKGWPANPRQVTQILKRQAPAMRRAGWEIRDDEGANHDKVIRWWITPPANLPEMAGIANPQHPHDPQDHGGAVLAGFAGLAGDENGPSQDELPTRASA
ncbi:MAG: hypothetical protein M3Q22_10110, partial [Actinomycetota bacterium]|nr:hypothetical protein [Actinomycetota bacterium]